MCYIFGAVIAVNWNILNLRILDMRKLTLFLSLLILTINANAAFIDFESFADDAMGNNPGATIPQDSQISDQFLTSDGVLFSSGNSFLVAVNLGLGGTPSGVVGVGGSTAVDGNLTYSGEFFRAEFFKNSNRGVTNFVSILGDSIPDGSEGTFSAFDINGTLLGSDSQIDIGNNVFELRFAGINSVSFTGSGTIGLDNFSFNTVSAAPQTVPIAPTLWLLGLGLFGILRLNYCKSRVNLQ